MAIFDASIFTAGADRAERRGARTQNTMQQLAQSFMKQDQLDKVRLDKQRVAALKEKKEQDKFALSEQGLYQKINATGPQSLTPEEQAAWQFHEVKRGSKQMSDSEGYRVSENAPLMGSPMQPPMVAPVQAPTLPQDTMLSQESMQPQEDIMQGLSPKARVEAQKQQVEEGFRQRRLEADEKRQIKKDKPKLDRAYRDVVDSMTD